MIEAKVRPARESDMQAIALIHAHYVLNTVKFVLPAGFSLVLSVSNKHQVVTFTETPRSVEDFIAEYTSIISQNLPYLVATDAGLKASSLSSSSSSEKVIGYANAHGFRGTKGAYRHTVEISLFCDVEFTGQGVGSVLLTALLNVLRRPEQYPELRHVMKGKGELATSVRQVLAVMSVDVDGQKQGLALKEFL
jgi:L-amino acid N-acyltransferase YncA